MTVMRIEEWCVKPGRLDAFLTLTAAAVPYSEQLGARNHRIVRIGAPGPDTGRYYSIGEFESMEAYGASLNPDHPSKSDPQAQAIAASWHSPDSPVVLEGRSMLTEIGAGGSWPGVGGGLLVRRWSVTPEGLEVFLADLPAASREVESHGGELRVFRNSVGGPRAGELVVMAGFENLSALGRYLDQLGERLLASSSLPAVTYGPEAGATLLEARLDVVVQ